jgi:hypothetical protein
MTEQERAELLARCGQGTVSPTHAREVAALIESFGYNDRAAQASGFPDVFSLARHLFARLQQDPAPAQTPIRKRGSFLWAEVRYVLRKFSLSLTYAIPWMALLVLEYLRPDVLQVSPEFGAALSLSLIASLIATGGFIQMISRSGNFYYGLEQPVLARRTCMSLLNVGLTSVLFLALLGMLLGSYFHLFSANYLLLAALNSVSLSLLWMLCAMLSVQGIGWCIPLVYVVSTVLSGGIRTLANLNATMLLMLWPLLSVLCALGCVLAGFHAAERTYGGTRNTPRPRFGIFFITLVPFYIYGTLYFGFLFADRLAAGSAVPWVSGLSFGIDSAYKRGMDLALFAFLITAALVEYLGDSFLRFWRRQAAELPQTASQQLAAGLRRRHWHAMFAIVSAFAAMSVLAWYVFSRSSSAAPSSVLLQTAALGGLGYLLLNIALLETIILASINAMSRSLLAVGAGLGVNLLIGYGSSHLWGVQFAAVGLLAGAAVVLWKCNAAVRRILQRPDYYYSIS